MNLKYTLRKFLLLLLTPLFAVLLMTACSVDDDGPGTNTDQDPNLVELAQSDNDFSILVDVIIELELDETLTSGNYTVFAPTNAAFNSLPDGLLDQLTTEQLTDIITYHVTGGSVPSTALDPQQDVTMLNEERTLVQSSAAGVLVNGSANVVNANLQASNGYIHAIDKVLLPKEIRVMAEGPSLVEVAEENGNFETLIDLAENVGLTTTLQFLGPFTAFAPTDDAFAALDVNPADLTAEQLQYVLSYHVLQGEVPSSALETAQAVPSAAGELLYITAGESGVFVNGSSEVTIPDVNATNGIIHVIDSVLLPNAFIPVTGIVAKNYDLTTLLELALDRPDIVSTLSGDGTFTVFAPTNEAFEAVLAENPGLTDEQITEILTYHVLTSTVLSADLEDGQSVETLQGENITVSIDGESVLINSSNVITADLEGSNGVVHIIDAVLLPPSYTME